jgi:hypothetical protein
MDFNLDVFSLTFVILWAVALKIDDYRTDRLVNALKQECDRYAAEFTRLMDEGDMPARGNGRCAKGDFCSSV